MELSLKSPKETYCLAVTLALGFFYCGYSTGIFNPLAEPILTEVFKLDREKDKTTIIFYQGAFNSVFSIGCVVGVLSLGLLADIFGRVPLLYFFEVFSIVNSFVYRIENLNAILLARFLTGVIVGTAPLGGIITSELLPNNISGFGNALSYLIGTASMLLAFITQNIFSRDTLVRNYKELLMACSIVSLVRIILLKIFLKSDTPHFLYQTSHDDHAAFENLKTCYECVYDEADAKKAAEEALLTFGKNRQNKTGTGSLEFKHLLQPGIRLRFLSGCFLATAQQICGIDCFIFYSTDLFNKLLHIGKSITVYVGVANLIGAILAIFMIGRLGRKFNFVWGCLIQAVSLYLMLAAIQTKAEWLISLSIMGYITAFAIGLGGSYQAYICEILPPIGIGIVQGIQFSWTVLMGQFLPLLNEKYGPMAMLLSFAVICSLLFIGLAWLTVETKGKREKEIADKFESESLVLFDFS